MSDGSKLKPLEILQRENEELRHQLEEAQETIEAIRSGAVDALVVEEPTGHRIYTLEGAERPYRLFVEEMQQGAATLHTDGTIAWCNRQLGQLLKTPPEKLVGVPLRDFVSDDSRVVYDNLLWQGQTRSGRSEAQMLRSDGAPVPVFLTFSALPKDCGSAIGVLVTDLTSQRHHEQLSAAHAALRESQRRLALVANTAPVFIANCDTEKRYKMVNEPYARRLGLAAEDCVGKTIAEVLGDAAYEAFRNEVETVLNGQPVEFEAEIPYANLGTHFMHCSYAPELDVDGKVVGFVAAITDITQRRQVEQALRESEGRFHQMADHAPVMVWVTEENGECSFLSKSWYQVTGQSPAEGLGFGWVNAVHPDDQPRSKELFALANRERLPFRSEYRLRGADGEYRWVMDAATPRFDENGNHLGYIGSVIDITERKQIEEQLRRNHETFFNLIENAPFGVYVVDAQFRMRQISAGSRKVFSNIHPLIGRDLAEVMRILWREPFATEVINRFRHTLETGESYKATNTTEQRQNVPDVESYDWKID